MVITEDNVLILLVCSIIIQKLISLSMKVVLEKSIYPPWFPLNWTLSLIALTRTPEYVTYK